MKEKILELIDNNLCGKHITFYTVEDGECYLEKDVSEFIEKLKEILNTNE